MKMMKLFFLMLFSTQFLISMHENEPSAKRRRVDQFCELPTLPLSKVKKIAKNDFVNLYSVPDNSNSDLYSAYIDLNDQGLFEIEIYNGESCIDRKKSKRILNSCQVFYQMERAIIAADYFLYKNKKNSQHCFDFRSDLFSKLLSTVINKQKTIQGYSFAVLQEERNRILFLPCKKMRVLVLWAIRNSMAAAPNLLEIVYSWLHYDNKIDHIVYPKSWLRVKI